MFTHIKKYSIDVWILKCVFIGYPEYIGLKMWKLEPRG